MCRVPYATRSGPRTINRRDGASDLTHSPTTQSERARYLTRNKALRCARCWASFFFGRPIRPLGAPRCEFNLLGGGEHQRSLARLPPRAISRHGSLSNAAASLWRSEPAPYLVFHFRDAQSTPAGGLCDLVALEAAFFPKLAFVLLQPNLRAWATNDAR